MKHLSIIFLVLKTLIWEVSISISDYKERKIYKRKLDDVREGFGVQPCAWRVEEVTALLKEPADAGEAGIGNLPSRGGLPESQRIKECGGVPCEGGWEGAGITVSQPKRQEARHLPLPKRWCRWTGSFNPTSWVCTSEFPPSSILNPP